MTEEKSLSLEIVEPSQPSAQTLQEQAAFDLGQRVSKLFAAADFVPTNYKGNVANCFVALDLAKRMELHPLMVMQNLYIPQGGIPAWKSQFLVAMTNPFLADPMDWEITRLEPKTLTAKGTNSWQMPNLSVIAYGKTKTGKVLRGPAASTEMAIAENWIRNVKYQTMPEVMLRWRAAAFFVRFYFPDRLCGFYTEDEIAEPLARPREVRINPRTVVENPPPLRLTPQEIEANKREATRQFQELLAQGAERMREPGEDG